MTEAAVVAIYLCPVRKQKMASVPQAEAAPRVGLAGDRYARQAGTFSKKANPANEITLIESEAVEAFAREAGVDFSPGDSRRNVVTRGVALNDLVGQEFCVGGVRLRGLKLCPPCTHLAGLTVPTVLRGLENRGGLRAQILNAGVIRVGDPIHQLSAEAVEAGEVLLSC